MRYLSWILILPLALLAILVAIANRERIFFHFDPLPWSIELPVYAILFIGIVIGLLVGLAAEWWLQRGWRRDARLHRRLSQSLSAENERLKGERAKAIEAGRAGDAQGHS